MEWKKEQLSASELEHRRQEYLNAAMNMMKRSHPAPDGNAASDPAAEEAHEAEVTEEESPAAEKEDIPEATDITSAADTGSADMPGADEASGEYEENDEEDAPEDKNPEDSDAEDTGDEKYGVFTADELMNGEYNGEGLKKAAEILEEMTRNAEMMKKLANEDNGAPDTTDFPDFSCGTDEQDGGMFREESSPEEGSGQPEQQEQPQ